MSKSPDLMTKPELVAEAFRLGLGRSKAQLDALRRSELLRKVKDALIGR